MIYTSVSCFTYQSYCEEILRNFVDSISLRKSCVCIHTLLHTHTQTHTRSCNKIVGLILNCFLIYLL